MPSAIRSATMALMAVAIAIALAGCGDSGDSTAAALSKTQFIKQADAICERIDTEQEVDLKKYLKQHPNGASAQAQAKLVTEVGIPPVSKGISEISELAAPSGDEKQVAAIVGEMESALSEAEEKPTSLLTTPTDSPFTAVKQSAIRYGFQACSDII